MLFVSSFYEDFSTYQTKGVIIGEIAKDERAGKSTIEVLYYKIREQNKNDLVNYKTDILGKNHITGDSVIVSYRIRTQTYQNLILKSSAWYKKYDTVFLNIKCTTTH